MTEDMEFMNVDDYLKLLNLIKPHESHSYGVDILEEFEDDYLDLKREQVYCFWEVVAIEDVEYFHIYDYVDKSFNKLDLKENFTLLKASDLMKLLKFQNAIV